VFKVDIFLIIFNFYLAQFLGKLTVLGTLINILNMRRVNTRGMAQANKHVLMAALCYNLKKLMNFSRPKSKSIAAAMRQTAQQWDNTLAFLLGFSEPH
jgi:hypothetical protein